MADWPVFLSLGFGALVGVSLGLTGGGGAIIAVPLLVFGLGLSAPQAAEVSLAAVGATALVGCALKSAQRHVEWLTGIVFGLGGFLAAPLGVEIAHQIPPTVLLLVFSGLMLLVAGLMWRQAAPRCLPEANGNAGSVDGAGNSHVQVQVQRPAQPLMSPRSRQICQRTPQGVLCFTPICLGAVIGFGALTGVLAGLFGVGGGFVIVPALTLLTGLSMHRAVGTSLLSIAIISAGGTLSHVQTGFDVPLELTLGFIGGGVLGLWVGLRLGTWLSGPTLQRVFAVVIVFVAAFVVWKSLTADAKPAASSGAAPTVIQARMASR